MTLEVLRGADAHRAIEDPSFRANWKSLHRLCPWSTVFQDVGFATTWYRVYRALHEPVVAVETAPDGAMLGLFLLARDRVSGALAHVGEEYAEYQTWIARPDRRMFVTHALDALRPIAEGATLQLRYVPSTLPLDPLTSSSDWGWRTVSWPEARGIAALTQTDSIASLIESSRYQYRLRRIAALGPVNFRTISRRAELEPWLDQIIAFCDVRQGAINAVFPFHDDSLHRELRLSLIDSPDLVHASLLTAGQTLISAQLNFLDHRTISLGLVSHSPMYGKISPGTLHLLLLARYAANAGFTAIDLTPAGEYKNRFASFSDPTRVVSIQFSATQAARAQVRSFAAQTVKTHIREMGLEPAQVKREWVARIARIRNTIARWSPSATSRRRRAVVGDVLVIRLRGMFETSQNGNLSKTPSADLRVNEVGDLLLPDWSGVPLRERRSELRIALLRFERGAQLITCLSEGVVTGSAWVARGPCKAHFGPELAEFELSDSSILVHDVSGQKSFVQDVIQFARGGSTDPELLVAVRATDVAMMQHFSALGSEIVARISPRNVATDDSLVARERPRRATTLSNSVSRDELDPRGTACH